MKTPAWALTGWLAVAAVPFGLAAKALAQPPSGDQAAISLWTLAKTKAQTHRFSTLSYVPCPNRVALYLFADGSWVIENFRDEAVHVELDGATRTVAPAAGCSIGNPDRHDPGKVYRNVFTNTGFPKGCDSILAAAVAGDCGV